MSINIISPHPLPFDLNPFFMSHPQIHSSFEFWHRIEEPAHPPPAPYHVKPQQPNLQPHYPPNQPLPPLDLYQPPPNNDPQEPPFHADFFPDPVPINSLRGSPLPLPQVDEGHVLQLRTII